MNYYSPVFCKGTNTCVCSHRQLSSDNINYICCHDSSPNPCPYPTYNPPESIPHSLNHFTPFPYPLPEIPTYVKITNPISSIQLEEEE